MTSAIPVQCSTNLADKPTGSVHNCEDRFHINLFIHSSHIDFHVITVIFSLLHGFILNQHNDQLPVSLLAQLVEVMDLNHVQA